MGWRRGMDTNYRRAMQQQGLDYYHYLDIAEE